MYALPGMCDGGGSVCWWRRLSFLPPSVRRPSPARLSVWGASQDDSVRGANMTSRREARRTTKEDSSSFFVVGEHRPAAWRERSLHSRARSQRRRCSYAHVLVSGCAIPSREEIPFMNAYKACSLLSSSTRLPSIKPAGASRKWPDASPPRFR